MLGLKLIGLSALLSFFVCSPLYGYDVHDGYLVEFIQGINAESLGLKRLN